MNEEVTVDEALAKGHLLVNLPCMLIMAATNCIGLYIGFQEMLPFWIIPAGFGLSIVLTWIYWSIMITRWRLWAFEHVRNVHELKKKAIQDKLIWPDNSIFGKTEIRTPAAKEKWKTLENKFQEEDEFHDDPTVPYETKIYYSKSKNYFDLVVMLLTLGGGIYLLARTDSYTLGSIITLIGAYFAYKEFKEATNNAPQIIINEKGIQTSSTKFYEWKYIENEEAARKGTGKNIAYYLLYDHPEGSERLLIDDFNTDQGTVNKLLTVYRGRYRNKNYYK